MLHQLGPATFFVSLSAAETRWNHLIRILGQTLYNKTYTDIVSNAMNWSEKNYSFKVMQFHVLAILTTH